MQTQHYIDSASIYQLVELYTRPSIDTQPYEWMLGSARQVTGLLITKQNIVMAASPSGVGAATGHYATLTTELSDTLKRDALTHEETTLDVGDSIRWAKENYSLLASAHDDLFRDQVNFGKWLEWSVSNAWREHSSRHCGLFDRHYIPAIAAVLKVEEEELQELHKESARTSIVLHFSEQQEETRSFRLTRSAYVIAALARGKFHDVLAQERKAATQLHHPFRMGVLSQPSKASDVVDTESNIQQALSNIVWSSAFSRSDPAERIKHYTESVNKVRRMLRNTYSNGMDITLPNLDNGDIAIDEAVRIAKSAGVEFASKEFGRAIEVCIQAGLAGLGLYFTPWTALAMGLGYAAIPDRLKKGQAIAEHFASRESQVRELAAIKTAGRLWPGR